MANLVRDSISGSLAVVEAVSGSMAGLVELATHTAVKQGVKMAKEPLITISDIAKFSMALTEVEIAGLHRKIKNVQEELCRRVEKDGFIMETHKVETSDGHILTLHRIPGPIGEPQNFRKPRVFLQHGLKCSSADWVTGGMAYTMARRGFDVWMGNFRGNNFSLGHKRLENSQKQFWNFSWDQHGSHDLPEMLNYARLHQRCEETDEHKHKISYVGHSMGSTAFFVMMNVKPNFNRFVLHAVLMAPVTNISGAFGFPARFFSMAKLAIAIANIMGFHSVNLPKSLYGYSHVSAPVLYAIGYHEMDPDMIRDILSYSPASTSTLNIKHYLASKERNYFCNYDDTTSYSLSKVACSVDLFWSPADWASGKDDVDHIRGQLTGTRGEVGVRQVQHENFGHLDFMWSTQAEVVYQEVANILLSRVENDESERIANQNRCRCCHRG